MTDVDIMCQQTERIKELEGKLEISPDHDWDGIDCRDETIKGLEQKVAELGRDLAVEKGWNKGQRRSLEETIIRYAKSEKQNTTLTEKLGKTIAENRVLRVEIEEMKNES